MINLIDVTSITRTFLHLEYCTYTLEGGGRTSMKQLYE